ncbi:hypothetical protein A1356_23190 [Methylomonas koyamae]|uniref:Uncharacterized protein n=2 Tax=Methylomonas koyamae TaxID=702114 RepID=A0AA91DFR7_9GAMM|nr:hypothetical protein A1356_23190 [Methylomonas koyamae]
MVWIKGWIETELARNKKQHAISRLLHDELINLTPVIQALKRMAKSASEGKLRLLSVDVSSLVSKFASELADLDPKRSYCYAGLASSLEIVNKGFQRLAVLTLSRATASSKDIYGQIDRALAGQARITASDYIAASKAALVVIKAIPPRNRYNNDAQALTTMENAIVAAEKEHADWPELPAQQGAQAGAAENQSAPIS